MTSLPEQAESRVLCLYPIKTPAGTGWIGLHDNAVVWLSFGKLDLNPIRNYWKGPVRKEKTCPLPAAELEAVAKGKHTLPISPKGTPFQVSVWKQLDGIPFGTTRTYGEIAARLGSPNKARAVGSAVGANPVAWLVPCHRILPANGSIGNYRWGADAKERLLTWERSQRGSGAPDLLPSRRRKLEEMLIKAQRFEDISKLSGDIAHDLNNLLAPIRMSTEMLKRKIDDNSLTRYIEIIETSTGRARAVIQEILSFSRESGGGEPQKLNVAKLLGELARLAHETFPKRIQIKTEFKTDFPMVEMDPTQLHRAVLNLLVNARDAIGGKGTVTLGVETDVLKKRVVAGNRELVPGTYVCIYVSDTGCGVNDDIRERIFDPFFTTKPKEQGTGLGLSSVYGIVGRSGGFVDMDSEPGKGTTFRIFLPELGT
jgi:O-6-methylguanine DNA methyltransferase